jgi:hypothetical protein
MRESSVHTSGQTAVHGSKSAESAVDLTSNALAMGVDKSDAERSAQQNCGFPSPSHCIEIDDLGGATPGQGDAPPTLPVRGTIAIDTSADQTEGRKAPAAQRISSTYRGTIH